MKQWLAIAGVVLAACAPAAPGGPTSADGSDPAVAVVPSDTALGTAGADGSAPPVAEALDFTAPLVGGGQLDGGDLAGRDVVLWFWAPW